MRDLLVAGGGPIGLGTALLAARRGLDVAVVEPRSGPVDKACGEGLMPAGVGLLAGLGVEPSGHALRGIRYVHGNRAAEAPFRDGPGLGVRRTVLHAALATAVHRAGIPVVRARAGDIRQDDESVRTVCLRARYLAVADGLHSGLRQELGLGGTDRGRVRYGLRRHFAVPAWTDHVEVHWARRAEAYVTPVGRELVGVAVLFSGRGTFETWLGEFPALRERLGGSSPVSAVRGAGPLRQSTRRRVAGRALLVGDAAGYVDALTGEGICVGLATAAALVRCVERDRPQEYEAEWRRVTRSYRLLTGSLLAVSGVPPLRSSLVPVADLIPGAFAAGINLLAGSKRSRL